MEDLFPGIWNKPDSARCTGCIEQADGAVMVAAGRRVVDFRVLRPSETPDTSPRPPGFIFFYTFPGGVKSKNAPRPPRRQGLQEEDVKIDQKRRRSVDVRHRHVSKRAAPDFSLGDLGVLASLARVLNPHSVRSGSSAYLRTGLCGASKIAWQRPARDLRMAAVEARDTVSVGRI